MSTVIYWFSGSGNSFHLANCIRNGLDDAELVAIPVAMESGPVPCTRLGLVFPVYAWGPPVIVARFISRLSSVEHPEYLFAAATYGGDPGSAISKTRKMLSRSGLELDAGFTVQMVENYPPMGGAPKKSKQERINEEADLVIADIVSKIRAGARGEFGKKGLFFSLVGPLVYPWFTKSLAKQARKFEVNEKCTSCGVCERVCPVGNIEVPRGEMPVWGDACEQCFACFHWCPDEAVIFGKKSIRQPRYHHPGTTLGDMILRRAEATGGKEQQ